MPHQSTINTDATTAVPSAVAFYHNWKTEEYRTNDLFQSLTGIYTPQKKKKSSDSQIKSGVIW